MRHTFQVSLSALGVVLLGLGCASADATQVTPGASATEGQGTAAAAEEEGEEDSAPPVEIEALLRENEQLIAKLDAEGRSPYSREETTRMLAAMGLRTWTYDELVAESTRQQTQPLSPAERALLDSHFARFSPVEELRFEGHTIFAGDMMVDADPLLEMLSDPERVVDKGFGCLQSSTNNTGCDGLVTTYLRDDGDGSPDTVDFRRPDSQRTMYMVVANNAPDFLFNALVEVTSRIEELNPTGDCLGSNAFVPIRQSAYDNLDAFTKAMAYVQTVTYGLDPCSGSSTAKGCGSVPKLQTVMLLPPGPNSGGVTQSRLAFGNTLKINSRFFDGEEDVEIRGTLFHELGHNMGRSHNVADVASHKIPGTSTDPAVASVLSLGLPNRPYALSGDDVQVIKTLYSDHPNRSDDSCTYTSSFRNFGFIPFNGCPANSIPNGGQDICCGPECGTCGGPGCSGRPGGTDACCTGRISTNGVSCTGLLSGPCRMP